MLFGLSTLFCEAAGAEGITQDCTRPTPPYPEAYELRSDYIASVEAYYAQASRYFDCLNSWIDEARLRYQEMFQVEAQTYLDERMDVMHEMRAFIDQKH